MKLQTFKHLNLKNLVISLIKRNLNLSSHLSNAIILAFTKKIFAVALNAQTQIFFILSLRHIFSFIKKSPTRRKYIDTLRNAHEYYNNTWTRALCCRGEKREWDKNVRNHEWKIFLRCKKVHKSPELHLCRAVN